MPVALAAIIALAGCGGLAFSGDGYTGGSSDGSGAVAGWLPAAGSGKHAHLNGGEGLTDTGGGFETGWDAADWNGLLATTSAQVASVPIRGHARRRA